MLKAENPCAGKLEEFCGFGLAGLGHARFHQAFRAVLRSYERAWDTKILRRMQEHFEGWGGRYKFFLHTLAQLFGSLLTIVDARTLSTDVEELSDTGRNEYERNDELEGKCI